MVVHPFHQSANRPMLAGPFLAPGGFAMMEMMTRQQMQQTAQAAAYGQQQQNGQFGAVFWGNFFMGAEGIFWGKKKWKKLQTKNNQQHFSGHSIAIHSTTSTTTFICCSASSKSNGTTAPIGHAIRSRLVPIVGKHSTATGAFPATFCQWQHCPRWANGQGNGNGSTATAKHGCCA